MIEREAFIELVRQALSHIYNPAFLVRHPLTQMLARGGSPLPAEVLQQALLDALHQLRPAQKCPQTATQWRHYRYLWLRYVEGVHVLAIAEALGITDRQARRDHRKALEDLAALLWRRYLGSPWPPVRSRLQTTAKATPAENSDILTQELAMLVASLPHGPTSLAETLSGVLQTAARLMERHGLQLDIEVEPDLPPIALPPVILRQILLNLIAHGAGCGAGSRMQLTAENRHGPVRLTVSYLISPGSTSARLHADDEAPLAVVRRLLEQEGGGMTLHQIMPDQEAIVLLLPTVPLTTVLFIDDNLDLLRLCQRTLEGTPYRALVAHLPTTALQIAREAQPDLVVLDVLMPSCDGWELMASFQRDDLTRHIPIVVCSVLHEPMLALELGAADFIPKPITPLSLLTALERFRPGRSGSQGSPPDISSARQP